MYPRNLGNKRIYVGQQARRSIALNTELSYPPGIQQQNSFTIMTDAASKNEIRSIVLEFFEKCKAPVNVVDYDEELYNATREMIIQLGYPLDDPTTMKGFNPYLKNAVYATVASYPHLTDLTIRAFATAYIALFLPIDDYFADKPGPISEFNSRLIQGIEQEHPLLEAYARLLRELPKHWDPVMADMMRQSAMTFLTSLVVERQLEDAKLPNVSDLARSIRTMTGTSLIHIMFAFPSGVPPQIYLAALPPMISFTEHTNDVLSFFKEELAGETLNYISLRAKINKTSKLEELKNVVNDCLNALQQIKQLEQDFPDVCGPLAPCWPGYLRFHLSAPRYRLLELLEA
ncbi:hypothetical protein AX14_003450 [Amanita brunnescens Koide BX004]|nr:hypothetical protein AX14_003450 [Amanita brunnescens Koide BX004]